MNESIYPVMINWNSRQDTLECVASLLAAGVSEGQIVIVDHASTDDSVPVLQERFGSAIHVLEIAENLGFAGGINRGVQFALGQGADWVLVMNNDTTVAGDFIAELEHAIQRHPEYTVFGPLILYTYDPSRVWYLADCRWRNSLITRSLYKDQVVPEDLTEFIEVDFISGCGMLVHRRVVEATGLFDPLFFMYAEDADFCWRARQAGFKIAAAPHARMWHKVSVSASRDKPAQRYNRIRNQIWFYRKYARGLQLGFLFLFSALRSLWIGARDIPQQQNGLLTALWRGWRDGWWMEIG